MNLATRSTMHLMVDKFFNEYGNPIPNDLKPFKLKNWQKKLYKNGDEIVTLEVKEIQAHA